jgi:hypothetical protein
VLSDVKGKQNLIIAGAVGNWNGQNGEKAGIKRAERGGTVDVARPRAPDWIGLDWIGLGKKPGVEIVKL